LKIQPNSIVRGLSVVNQSGSDQNQNRTCLQALARDLGAIKPIDARQAANFASGVSSAPH